MIGINIGVPVPREPFSFGGSKNSKPYTLTKGKFGSVGDITGDGAVSFFSRKRKVTEKWEGVTDGSWMS